jgi:hypothetical protein
MIKEKLQEIGILADWEIEFIARYAFSVNDAYRMAFQHLLRNAQTAGRPIEPILKAFEAVKTM